MKILIVCMEFPYPPNAGGKIRDFNLIRLLSQKHKIYLISLIKSPQEKKFLPEMMKYCSSIETVVLRKRSKLEHLPGVVRCLLSGQPLLNKFFFLKEMEEKIRRLIITQNFDIIQIEHSCMAPYIKAILKSNNSKKILTFHNIGFIQYKRMFEVERNIYKKTRFLLNWIPMRKWEPKIAGSFDKCITTSELDKQILQSINSKLDISVIPNGVDIDKYRTMPINLDIKNFLFVGNLHYEPNIDAALYFYKEIFPIIKIQIPDSKFFIVGSNPSHNIRQFKENKNVIVTGYVDDVQDYYSHCAISVVPLRAGGGTRLKILESMALGRPVVSTSLGCEGLGVTHAENILIADKPKEFARCVIELLKNIELREEISRNARKFVEVNYSWNKIAEDLIHIYEEMINN